MNIKKNLFYLSPLCLLAVTSLTLQAHEKEGDAERAIEYRQSVMTVFGWNMKPMGAMIKGAVPFDQAAFAKHAKDLDAAAHLDLLAGFPEDSEGDDSDARADIWLNFDDFKQKYADLQTAVGSLHKAAEGNDQAAIKDAFGGVGKACKACHKAYKD